MGNGDFIYGNSTARNIERHVDRVRVAVKQLLERSIVFRARIVGRRPIRKFHDAVIGKQARTRFSVKPRQLNACRIFVVENVVIFGVVLDHRELHRIARGLLQTVEIGNVEAVHIEIKAGIFHGLFSAAKEALHIYPQRVEFGRRFHIARAAA